MADLARGEIFHQAFWLFRRDKIIHDLNFFNDLNKPSAFCASQSVLLPLILSSFIPYNACEQKLMTICSICISGAVRQSFEKSAWPKRWPRWLWHELHLSCCKYFLHFCLLRFLKTSRFADDLIQFASLPETSRGRADGGRGRCGQILPTAQQRGRASPDPFSEHLTFLLTVPFSQKLLQLLCLSALLPENFEKRS